MTEVHVPPRLPFALLILRLGVGIVFAMWTLDKFVNPGHTANVFAHFYLIPSLSSAGAIAVGVVQAAIVLAFVTGTQKRWSYLAVLAMHAVSTVSPYAVYLDPWTGPHLLFFAAFPMLGACWTLWALRDYDTLWCVDARRQTP